MTQRAQQVLKKRNEKRRRETPEFADRDPLAELTDLSSYLLYSEGVRGLRMEHNCFVAELTIRDKKGEL